MGEQVCAADGTRLRDLSVTSIRFGDTTVGVLPMSESLPPRCEGHTTRAGHTTGGGPHAGHQDQLVGRILGDRWRVEQWIGSGGFGDFFRGRHVILDMTVGIKVLRTEHTRTEETRRRFYREALRVSRLDHPNVVKVFDYGEEDDRAFLVMEYLAGQSLARHLRDGTLQLADGVEVVRQAAVALMAAHAGQQTGGPLVHLDLKPEHLFLEQVRGGWHVKVIDFGLAEIVEGEDAGPDSAGPTGRGQLRVAGTLPYMAPERWLGVVDPRADLYSLGVVLYELIAGRLPFHADDPSVMKALHETEVPTPPSRHRSPGREPLLPELDALTLWTLEKDPNDRPASAEDLVCELEAWQERVGLGTLRRAWRRWSSAPGAVKVAATSMALLLALAALYLASVPSVEVLASETLTIGPTIDALAIRARHAGWYHGEDDAFVVLRDRQGRESSHLVRGTDVYRLQWSQVASLVQEGQEETFAARLDVVGLFGRRFASSPFTLVVDRMAPELRSITGAIRVGSSLYLDSSHVTFEFTPGSSGSVAVDGGAPQSFRGSSCQVELREAKRITLAIRDAVNNERREELALHRFAPVVEGAVDEDGAQVVRTCDGWVAYKMLEGAIVDPISEPRRVLTHERCGDTGRFRIAFDNDPAEQTQEVILSASASDAASSVSCRQKLCVRYLKRELTIGDSKSGEPPFDVVDATGRVVARTERASYYYIRGNELVQRDRPPAQWYLVRVEGEDEFGNPAQPRDFYPMGPPPLLKLAVTVARDSVGSPDRPLHGDWCCSAPRSSDEMVTFDCQAQWPFGPPRPKIKVDATGKSYAIDASGRITIPRRDLGPIDAGTNSIAFSLEDPLPQRGAKGTVECPLSLMGEWKLDQVNDKVVDAPTTEVVLRVNRMDVYRVEIAGRSAVQRAPREWVLTDVPVPVAGEQRLDVVLSARSATGTCLWRDTVSHSRRESPKLTYSFELNGLGTIRCRYCAAGAQPFWYTTVDSACALLSRFRREFASEATGAASWIEAAQVADWATKKLELNGGGEAVLPSLKELALLPAGAPGDAPPQWEWLADVPTREWPDAACFAEWQEDGAIAREPRLAYREEVGPAFRLILRNTALSASRAEAAW